MSAPPPPGYNPSFANMAAPLPQFPGYHGTMASVPASQANFQPGGRTLPPVQCTSKIELRISCKNLLDRDVTSKSDPMVAVYTKNVNKWIEVGRTENIRNCLNPEFSKAIPCNYFFETVQHFKFAVYDIDNSTPGLDDDDSLGFIECTLGQIVSSKSLSKNLMLKCGSRAGHGSITINADEVDKKNNALLQLKFSAHHLDKKDFFGKSDPFLEFKRLKPDGTYILCHRTEYIESNLNPVWKQIEIEQRVLCGDNVEQKIKILCYDYDSDGGHDFIGECTTSILQLSEAAKNPVTWDLINSKKQAKKGSSYKNSGTLTLNSFISAKMYSFVDYISSGTKLNFIVAVDFTASNGNPSDPNSLHYCASGQPNEYMQAISSIGLVLQDYDSDQMFPALGFGGNIPPRYETSHLFALNFNMSNPFCSGVQGILDTYSTCLRSVQLYGPTYVSPVIRHAAMFARQSQQSQKPDDYFVLLILTDGVILDMDETRAAIVDASNLPLSIIIIGVGQADFTDMNILDGDDGILKSPSGIPVARDIVQFVPFRKFARNTILLTQEVLAEVPKQLAGYYVQRRIPPKSQQ